MRNSFGVSAINNSTRRHRIIGRVVATKIFFVMLAKPPPSSFDLMELHETATGGSRAEHKISRMLHHGTHDKRRVFPSAFDGQCMSHSFSIFDNLATKLGLCARLRFSWALVVCFVPFPYLLASLMRANRSEILSNTARDASFSFLSPTTLAPSLEFTFRLGITWLG